MTPNNNLCGLIVGTEMIAKITSLDKQTKKLIHIMNGTTKFFSSVSVWGKNTTFLPKQIMDEFSWLAPLRNIANIIFVRKFFVFMENLFFFSKMLLVYRLLNFENVCRMENSVWEKSIETYLETYFVFFYDFNVELSEKVFCCVFLMGRKVENHCSNRLVSRFSYIVVGTI